MQSNTGEEQCHSRIPGKILFEENYYLFSFFTLDLPRYPTYEEAREKILQSILYCGDIDGDNLDY